MYPPVLVMYDRIPLFTNRWRRLEQYNYNYSKYLCYYSMYNINEITICLQLSHNHQYHQTINHITEHHILYIFIKYYTI